MGENLSVCCEMMFFLDMDYFDYPGKTRSAHCPPIAFSGVTTKRIFIYKKEGHHSKEGTTQVFRMTRER